jgi:hypothetical protein
VVAMTLTKVYWETVGTDNRMLLLYLHECQSDVQEHLWSR